jgi:hypothetical protein
MEASWVEFELKYLRPSVSSRRASSEIHVDKSEDAAKSPVVPFYVRLSAPVMERPRRVDPEASFKPNLSTHHKRFISRCASSADVIERLYPKMAHAQLAKAREKRKKSLAETFVPQWKL